MKNKKRSEKDRKNEKELNELNVYFEDRVGRYLKIF